MKLVIFLIVALLLGQSLAAETKMLPSKLDLTKNFGGQLKGVTNGTGQDAATVSQTNAAIASANDSLKAYVDANDTLLDADIVNANASMKAYVDLTAPTADQKAALAGTSGVPPSDSNKLVDNSDSRLSDPRTPIEHDHTDGPFRVTHDGGAEQAIITTPGSCDILRLIVVCKQAAPTRTLQIGWAADPGALMTDAEAPKLLNGIFSIRDPLSDPLTSATEIIATVGGSGDGEWDIYLVIVRYA
ncbi:hypothetical protein M0R72_12350 [Candidatus Pacearchaeota archaeon]|jgi:hypothetical protein|nr:hypothetical protein [Candidatus Pacearchaeota archaeon]